MVAMLGGPFLGAAPVARLLRYLLAGSGLLAVVAALLLLRPRLPPRAPGASQDQYWSQASTFVAALRLWMIVEGGGSIAAVGYILAGGLETIVVAGVALGILALSGPARLSGE